MNPKTWLEYQQYEDVNVEITQSFYNAYRTQNIFVEKYLESWDPKIYGPRNYIQIFYVNARIKKCRNKKHYPLENSSKVRKNRRSTSEKKCKCIVIILKPRMMHYFIKGKIDLYFY